MRSFVNQMGLVRELGRCPKTVAEKLASGAIVADAIVITGGKRSLLFDRERLPALKQILSPPQVLMKALTVGADQGVAL